MEAILNGIKSIFSDLSGFFENFIYLMQQIGNAFLEIGGFLVSILGFLYYAGKTLIVGLYKLLGDLIEGDFRVQTMNAFYTISDYIGIHATMFLLALFFIVIIRILVAFIFKILRLNLDYKVRTTKGSRKNREPTDYVEDVTYPRMGYRG